MFQSHPISRRGKRLLVVGTALLMSLTLPPALSVGDVDMAYQYEYEVMDKYHNTFDVYTDMEAGGNHFQPSGWMGDPPTISLDSECMTNCRSGTTCIRIAFAGGPGTRAGVYWQEPENNWGTVQNGGYNLSGATTLTFWARGEHGGENVEFFVGGIDGPHPDSLQKISTDYITLTTAWTRYTIDLSSQDLSHVVGGFGWYTDSDHSPTGAVFYLDDIQYDLPRPDAPRLLLSYEAPAFLRPDGPARNACYTYDNALALLSFLARGQPEDLRRAQVLADAFVYAQNHDRYYADGRLRNAYNSGDLSDHLTGDARLPLWWDAAAGQWREDESHVSTSTGNLAWVMVALLAYYEQAGGAPYLESAQRLGEWIHAQTADSRGAGGYTGGYVGWEPVSQKVMWKSTEHNTAIYAAFLRLYGITNDAIWQERALHARDFVTALWNDAGGNFWTGTLDNGSTLNQGNIPVDVQAWVPMALGRFYRALTWAVANCYTEADGFQGFDYNTDNDGIWFEGTAQMALAYRIGGQPTKAESYLSELRRAQAVATNGNGRGLVAASHDGVSTGFGGTYHDWPHIGATAWYTLAELGYDPFQANGVGERPEPMAVYRFWSPVYSRHFYTIREAERDKLISQYPQVWTYERTAYRAFADDSRADLSPIYRFWSGTLSAHFYTINRAERDKLMDRYSRVWTYEGIAFYAYAEGFQPPDTVPLYRFWSGTLNCHFYTSKESEKQKLIDQYRPVWTYEGIAWYAYE